MNPLGPLFVHELARVTRRSRPIMGRCLYVLLLLVLLGLIYLSLFPHGPQSFTDFLFANTANARDLANFGYAFFFVFTIVQYAIGTFAVASASSAILAEEKERQTLPFLLTTTLSDREIVFGKLAARVAQILMILLAGLPVLAVMQVMGGIDPQLLAAAFVATGATIISFAGMGAAVSITSSTVKQATSRAIGFVFIYLAGVPLFTALIRQFYGPVPLPFGTIGDAVELLNSGNLFWAIVTLGDRLGRGATIDTMLPGILIRYLIFHALLATITIAWSALRMRRVIAGQFDRAITKATKTTPLVGRPRKPVSQTRPVYWRETATAVGRAGLRWYHRWAKVLLYLATFAPVVIMLLEGFLRGRMSRGRMGRELHDMIRVLGTMIMCVALMHIASTASQAIGRERRQKTIDELYLTSLRNREILEQKGQAALWGARWFFVWVIIHWALDLALGGLSPVALVLVPAFYAMYAWAALQIGLAYAVHESPRFKAGPLTLFTIIGLSALPFALPIAHGLATEFRSRVTETLASFACGLSPPAVIGILTLSSRDLNLKRNDGDFLMPFTIGLIAGFLEWGLIGLYCIRRAARRFQLLRRE